MSQNVKYTNCLLAIRVIQIVYCFSEDAKRKRNMVVRFTNKKTYKKEGIDSPLSPGMQEHVPEHGEKVRNACIKNIQIVHCVTKSVGHIVNPFLCIVEVIVIYI